MTKAKSNTLTNGIFGWLCLLALWYLSTELEIINSHVLPSPGKTWSAFSEMLEENHLIENIGFSLKISFAGYIESILFAIPVGFALGLFKSTREMFSQPVDSMRFIPITALGGIFIALSGLTIWTKIHFLAFGIWVYLVPVIVQRISEVNPVHLQMMQTLGATKVQTLWHVQWKSVISRLSDDIRILVGISWTYIIVAEMKNVQGGVGSLIFLGEKGSNMGKVYACIILIVIIGVLQDTLFKWIDKLLFKFKYS
jgi:NitT/TauT family transport system permease protein